MSFGFVRIDSRFVHGQVGARLVRQFSIQRILLVDDGIAKDDFMKTVYTLAGVNGAKVEIYSVQEAADKFKEGAFEKKCNLLLFGSIDSAYRALMAGLEYKELDVGSIKADRENMGMATNLIYITEKDARQLEEIQDKGVNAYFQSMPDTPIVSIEKGIENAGFKK